MGVGETTVTIYLGQSKEIEFVAYVYNDVEAIPYTVDFWHARYSPGELYVGMKVPLDLYANTNRGMIRFDRVKDEQKKGMTIRRCTSSDPAVATVDQNGTATAVGAGRADITIEMENGETYRAYIEVPDMFVPAQVKKGNATWYIPEKIKLGYQLQPLDGECGGVALFKADRLPASYAGRNLHVERKNSGVHFSYPPAGVESGFVGKNGEGYGNVTMQDAIWPGKITFQAVLHDWDGTFLQNAGEQYTVTIEEPVIKTNEPKKAYVGSTFTFTSELQNTAFVNQPLQDSPVEIADGGRCDPYRNLRCVYQPEFTIESGGELLEVSNGDFSHTLTASEQLKFVKAGTVKLKVKYKQSDLCAWYADGRLYEPEKTVVIQVSDYPVKASSISLSPSVLTLKKGKAQKLTAKFLPADTTNRAVKWSSSNARVASVDASGKVTGKSCGTAVITAAAKDGSGKLAKCRVTVGYSITYKLNGGKNNAKNPAAYYKGTVTLKNPARKGYLFKGWYTDKKFQSRITKIKGGSRKNLTLYARWEKVKVGKAQITSLKSSGKKAVLKYKKVSGASGYEILYSRKKNMSGPLRVTVKKTGVTLNSLSKGAYYVKVRAYRTDSAGKKVYGAYSAVKKVQIKR